MSDEANNWKDNRREDSPPDANEPSIPAEESDDIWDSFDWTEGFRSWELNLPEDASEDAGAPAEPAPPVQSASSQAPSRKKKRQPHSLAESILAALLYVAGILALSFLIATVGWRWANDLLALDKTEKTVSISISSDQTINDVADTLKANGLIEYKFLFKTFAAITHKADKITTGTYELNTEMDYSALLTSISSTSVYREKVTVTIPEGYTLEETFQLLDDRGVCSAEDLLTSAQEDSFDYSFIQENGRTGEQRLEGYLFPDTYEFYMGTDAKSVISRLLSTFNDKFDSVMDAEQQLMGYSTDEIVIIASIIEKETTGDDRNDISSVIHNRLNNPDYDNIGGYLQMDSTVQYVLEERKEHLTNEDIAIDSPYNTYVVQGLPVGPICNPGLNSIKAALEPNTTDYYYFMLGDDGEDHFFTNSDSFLTFKAAQTGSSEDVEGTGEAEDTGEDVE